MNYFALLIGVLVAIYVLLRFRKTKLERKKWAYPLLLATFPVYYWVFALYASDYAALLKEIMVGVLFIGIAFMVYKNTAGKTSLVILSLAYIVHAIYDVIHHSLFLNQGTPVWWPEFCGAVDMLIGLYLLYLGVTFKATDEISTAVE